MDPRVRLKAGQEAFREGRYQDALTDYIWFHEHALEHDPAYYGVRLSFALMYWLELASVYPEARAALEAIRDRKTKLIRSHQGSRELFHDVESINDRLNSIDATYGLFRDLAAEQPELAERCADLALPSLIAAKDFDLAKRYIPDPEAAIRAFGDDLNANIAALAVQEPTRAPVREAYVANYATSVREVLDVLHGIGEFSDAARLKREAVAAVSDTATRAMVESALRRENGQSNST